MPTISDIIATTISSRTRKIADNVTNNNIVLKKMEMKGKIKPFSGGDRILQELSYAENANAGWYSGYDILPVGISDVITAAEFDIKQFAVPVVISGLEMLKNSGKERMIDLLDSRVSVAEATMANQISTGLYSDGSLANGKQIDGLNAAVPVLPAAAPYGGIDGSVDTFWQNQVSDNTAAAVNSSTITGLWNDLWAECSRGSDMPDLILCDNTVWATYTAALQANQRFTDPTVGDSGFPTLKFMGADVYFDGGIGGACPAGTAFFLNCDYIHYRPHAQRNMVPLAPNKRYATNQDAEVQILAWAGNLTCSGRKFQGRFDANG